MKAKEGELKKLLAETRARFANQETKLALDQEKIQSLENEVEAMESKYNSLQESIEQKFQEYKTALLGLEGLGAIAVQVKETGIAIVNGVVDVVNFFTTKAE